MEKYVCGPMWLKYTEQVKGGKLDKTEIKRQSEMVEGMHAIASTLVFRRKLLEGVLYEIGKEKRFFAKVEDLSGWSKEVALMLTSLFRHVKQLQRQGTLWFREAFPNMVEQQEEARVEGGKDNDDDHDD
eukprot:6466572-Amphidinium_carterae.1